MFFSQRPGSLGFLVALPLLIIMADFSVSGNENTGTPFSVASCNFALELLKTQGKLNEGNVVLSPNSIGILLAILQQGARENTLNQLQNILHMSPEESRKGHETVMKSLQREKKNVTLEWGNRAYVKPGYDLDDSFKKTIKESFDAVIEELNFAAPAEAANVINDWVKEITQDNIKDIISPAALTPDTVMLLVNAIYYKGLWDVPFSRLLTKMEKFEVTLDNSVEVPFMAQKERFIAGEDLESGIKWVDLPFKDEQFSMLFILPVERHGLSQVLEKLTGDLLRRIISWDETSQVTLMIPKFKLSVKVLLAKALQQLGLADIFTDSASLQGIASNKNLKVSKIVHQANVEIDEDGSTASAASIAILTEVLSVPRSPEQLIFKADHPFLFFILDKFNHIPLFAGRVSSPN